MRQKLTKIILLTLALTLLFSISAAAVEGREVMERVESRETGETRHALMGMDLINVDGDVRARVIETWSKKYDSENDLDQTVMVFHEPSSVRNTRFLQVENEETDDDQWIYLPDLGRVRRISGSQGEDSFMGSDFTYDDMQGRNIDDFEYELLREETMGEYETYVVESIPKNPAEEQYSKTISWVTKEHYIPIKMEMYHKDTGELYKEMTVDSEIREVDGIWTIFSTTMKNLDTGHSTRLYVQERDGEDLIQYNVNIDDSRFTQQFLRTGR